MTPLIKEVKIKENYCIEILYEKNEKRLFNFEPYLTKGRLNELRNLELFTKVKISFDTLEWENGIDIDPDTLYRESIKLN